MSSQTITITDRNTGQRVRFSLNQSKILESLQWTTEDLRTQFGRNYKASLKPLIERGLVRELKSGVKRTVSGLQARIQLARMERN